MTSSHLKGLPEVPAGLVRELFGPAQGDIVVIPEDVTTLAVPNDTLKAYCIFPGIRLKVHTPHNVGRADAMLEIKAPFRQGTFILTKVDLDKLRYDESGDRSYHRVVHGQVPKERAVYLMKTKNVKCPGGEGDFCPSCVELERLPDSSVSRFVTGV